MKYKYSVLSKAVIKRREVKSKVSFDLFLEFLKKYFFITQKQARFLYELYSLLFKKKLYEEQQIAIARIGRFYIFDRKLLGPCIRFRSSKVLKRNVISNSIDLKRAYTEKNNIKDIMLSFRNYAGLDLEKSKIVFKAWCESITNCLLRHKHCTISGLGFLYVMKFDFVNKVRFKSYDRISKELSGESEISIHFNRMKRLAKFNKISIQLKKVTNDI